MRRRDVDSGSTIAPWLRVPSDRRWLANASAPLPTRGSRCAHCSWTSPGLCVAARREDYVIGDARRRSNAAACTAIGHAGSFDAFGAALVNGTAAHGEDFDDTFEGGPVHSGAVIVPAVLAVVRARAAWRRSGCWPASPPASSCSAASAWWRRRRRTRPAFTRRRCSGRSPRPAACGARRSSCRRRRLRRALGIAGSMASGIIEYLAEGAWTKRLHAGWAAQSGIRAALLARGGFVGPRTVFEGTHGFYHAFAPSVTPDFAPLVDESRQPLGDADDLAFKPYACGTMTQPFIDCAIRLAESGVSRRRSSRDRVRRGRGHGPPVVGAARRQAPATDVLCREVQHAVLHRRRLLRPDGRDSRSSRSANPR